MAIMNKKAILYAMASLLCLLLAIVFRRQLSALMSLHMLVQIPLLVLAGVLAEQALVTCKSYEQSNLPGTPGLTRQTRPQAWHVNEYGVPGLVFLSFMGALWMIPKVLDDALTSWPVALFKYAGLPLGGYLLALSVRRANTVIKVFFLGNFCWMSAIVGIIYIDQPVRLCNAYLQQDQEFAGYGLIALAIGWPLLWLLARGRQIFSFISS